MWSEFAYPSVAIAVSSRESVRFWSSFAVREDGVGWFSGSCCLLLQCANLINQSIRKSIDRRRGLSINAISGLLLMGGNCTL